MDRIKVVVFTLAITVILACFCFAGGVPLYSINMEQIDTCMPDIIAYFNISGTGDLPDLNVELEAEDARVTLNGEQLEVLSLERQSQSGYGVDYYYLIDISTSVSRPTLNAFKEGIKQHLSQKGTNDRIIVISFGAQVNVVLDGSEQIADASEKISAIYPTDSVTRMYDAIAKATELVSARGSDISNRSVLFLVTDGVDMTTGGNTEKEALNKLEQNGMPIYAFGYSHASENSLNSLGEFARGAGGELSIINQYTARSNLAGMISRISGAFRIECRANNNVISNATGSIKIDISINGESITASRDAAFCNWVPDNDPPQIMSAKVVGENQIEIQFSEDVVGADSVESYVIAFNGRRTIEVQSVLFDAASHTAILVAGETLYSGNYSIKTVNIVDVSNEKNPIDSVPFEFNSLDNPKDFKYYISKFFYVPLIIVITVLILMLIIKKNRAQSNETDGQTASACRDGVYLPQADGIPVEITVVDSQRVERRVNAVIGGAYIIGRKREVCELAIEDRRLSRQHCAILNENGILCIRDLESTNGTAINGIKIENARDISDSDVITLGNSKIIVKRIK